MSSTKIALITASVTIASTLMLSGCQTAKVKTLKTNFNPTVLSFKYDGTENEVNNKSITREISQSIHHALSNHPDEQEQVGRLSDGSASGINTVQGKSINFLCNTATSCRIDVSFINGSRYTGSGQERLSKQVINIPIVFERSGNELRANVSLTGSITETTATSPLFIKYDHLLSTQQLDSVQNGISKISPSVNFTKTFKGEIEVEADDTIIYANFKRTMGFYKYPSDYGSKDVIGKTAALNLRMKTGNVPLFIETYPTHSGSITSYKFTQKFSALPDGTTTFKQGLVDGAIRTIENTARR
jgi:hypothetical protein